MRQVVGALAIAMVVLVPMPAGASSVETMSCDASTASACVEGRSCLERAGVTRTEYTLIRGTTGNDVLVGTDGPDVILAFDGNDKIEAGAGKDVVCAGSGKDRVYGGANDDVLLGGAGEDIISGDRGDDVLRGGAGSDVLSGGKGRDVLHGDGGDDGLYGGGGADTLSGGAGDDACFGGGATDVIEGCRVWGQDAVRYGSGGGVRRYTVIVEDGVAVNARQARAEIDRILGDERSWIGGGATRFERVGPNGDWDFRIVIASPSTTDRLCLPLRTGGYLSCRNGNTIALNVNRWKQAVPHFGGQIETYRQYLVNHEVGHMLGRGHVSCPGAGRLAPVMMQQTKSLGGCKANGWVYP